MILSQAVIESELESYLAGFCSHCDKPREGKLCGCAFPCSLTFKVLLKILRKLKCNKPREGKLCGCAFPCSLTFKVSLKFSKVAFVE